MEIFIGIVVIGVIVMIIVSINNTKVSNENNLIIDKVINNNIVELVRIRNGFTREDSNITNEYFREIMEVFLTNNFDTSIYPLESNNDDYSTSAVNDIIRIGEMRREVFIKVRDAVDNYRIEHPKLSDFKYYFHEEYIDIISQHIKTLSNKYKQLVTEDDYGNKSYDRYFKEIEYFMNDVLHIDFERYSISGNKLFEIINEMIFDFMEQEELNAIKNGLVYDEDIDPIEYEHFCKDLLTLDGWNAKVTQATADQGVDVIATNNEGLVIAVQCKKYSSPVGNKAVQEIFSAKQHYNADVAIVVTNNTYTKSAKELANTTNVLLLHHDDLRNLSSLL